MDSFQKPADLDLLLFSKHINLGNSLNQSVYRKVQPHVKGKSSRVNILLIPRLQKGTIWRSLLTDTQKKISAPNEIRCINFTIVLYMFTTYDNSHV